MRSRNDGASRLGDQRLDDAEDARHVRVVGGAGGWGRTLPRKSYANDAGVKLAGAGADLEFWWRLFDDAALNQLIDCHGRA